MALRVPHRGRLFVAGLSVLVCATPVSRAADPQPYNVQLKSTGHKPLDKALHDASTLISLEDKAPVGGFALVERARQDETRFQTVLQSFGYYKAHVAITIDQHALTDINLPGVIDRLPEKPPVTVDVNFAPGPLFHLGSVAIKGTVPPQARAKLDLKPGQPAVASDVVAAQDRLLAALRDESYPLAKVTLAPATLELATDQLDVVFDAETGPRADLGQIQITGLKDMHEPFVRRRLLIHPGEPFSPEELNKARTDLMSLGVFSTVRMEPADRLDPSGNLPITVQVTERPLHAVDLGAGYATDLGLNFNVGWHDRNLFGNAEQLNLSAGMNFGGNATTKPGYKFGAQFIKPDFPGRHQRLELNLAAIKQSLQAYDQRALTQEIRIHRQISHWDLSYGLLGEQEEIAQEGTTRDYNLVGIPLVAKYDTTNSLLDPTEGIRARLSITPMHAISGNGATFFIMQAAGSTYFDLSGNGRSVVAMRGLAGKIAGAGVFSVPPDQRFYAGGSNTVRGYRYQSIGPKFPDGEPTGGNAIAAGSLEFRQRIFDKYGVAAFVDAGQVSNNGVPFTSHWRIGAGVGFRYFTPIGPIRLDVAVPLNKEHGGDSFEFYIGIGQAF